MMLFDFADNGWHIGFAGAVELANQYPNAQGDPNGEGARWDAWTPEAKTSMVFDGDEGAPIVGFKDVSKTYDQIIAEMEADGTLPAEPKDGVIKNVINGRWSSKTQDERLGVPDRWVTGFGH